MKLQQYWPAKLLLYGAPALFITVVQATASTYTQEKCYTPLGSQKPATVSTVTAATTFTIPLPLVSTYTPSTTVKPSPSTSTSTVFTTSVTTTTPAQKTATFSKSR